MAFFLIITICYTRVETLVVVHAALTIACKQRLLRVGRIDRIAQRFGAIIVIDTNIAHNSAAIYKLRIHWTRLIVPMRVRPAIRATRVDRSATAPRLNGHQWILVIVLCLFGIAWLYLASSGTGLWASTGVLARRQRRRVSLLQQRRSLAGKESPKHAFGEWLS